MQGLKLAGNAGKAAAKGNCGDEAAEEALSDWGQGIGGGEYKSEVLRNGGTSSIGVTLMDLQDFSCLL
eukprot:747539-Hanusia_phi.AAC.1